ncbi:glycoside hydrolase family 1 protein [Peribacillus muralis]|uniref:glycoside hydrolase family 1 protein n=1 Tax=Peribacillus muralis TaxID=264697 RepID=UPI0007098A86|nr:glycoside hydrolase family 1 protein [Peribacillus muralis]
MKLEFPKGFYWGSAASATQTEGAANEGGKGKNIWDHWYEIEPRRFYDEVGPGKASEFYHHLENDLKLLNQTGHNSFRPSISWSRMFPKGYGEVNQDAIKFYNKLIDGMIAEGVEPFINLYHFDMPFEMQKIGGFENKEVVNHFVKYAETCFDLFGDRVKRWFTFNEPIVPVHGGYLYDFHYPNKVDPKAAFQVAYNTILASAKAIAAYKKSQDGKIGIVLNLTPSYPRSQHPSDLEAARISDLFSNRAFLDPSVKGTFPEGLKVILERHSVLPDYSIEELEIIKKNKVDYLGVNYYHPHRVCARTTVPNLESPFMPEFYYENYEMPGRRMNIYKNWEIYEQGLYDIALNIRDNYGNIEWMVSENGMGVKDERRFAKEEYIEDDYRIEFYEDHLYWLHKGIQAGSNCIGYHVWTFIDNWSWMNAYRNRYGLVSLNLKTGTRTIKKSGYWLNEVKTNNGFEYKREWKLGE